MELLEMTRGVLAMSQSITGLARAILDFDNAPAQIAELKNELQSLTSLLEDIGDRHSENRDIQGEKLRTKDTLDEIHKIYSPFANLAPHTAARKMVKLKWALQREKRSTLRHDLNNHITRLGLLFNAQTMLQVSGELTIPGTVKAFRRDRVPDIVIAVMGETGSGKSHLIREITGSADVQVGHSLHSECWAYSIDINGRSIILVDTPGFDDTYRTDVDVLEAVSSWLAHSYKEKRLLSGIIYLHPITSTRMRGSSVKSLEVFTQLIGPESFHNIALVTTMWDLLPDSSTGKRRETQLREDFWGALIDKGSITARSFGDRDSVWPIIARIAFDKRTRSATGAALKIQREMVEEHKTLDQTSAGAALGHILSTIEMKHRVEIAELRQGSKKERMRLQKQIDVLNEKQEKLKQPAVLATAEQSDESSLRPFSTAFTRFNWEAFADPGPPPTYLSGAPWRTHMHMLADALLGILIFSMMPVYDLWSLLEPIFGELMRPRLQRGHSRIEWICRCGEVMYGDYIEGAPGSLQRLASQLGGKVIAGPEAQQVERDAPSAPSPSPQSHQGGTHVTGAESSGSSTQQPRTSGPSARGSYQQLGANFRAISNQFRWERTPHKWLEMCISSSPNTYVLGEVDTTMLTDRAIFYEMKRIYEDKRKVIKLFGSLPYRVPNGGVFVKFRIDRLLGHDGRPPTTSVMESPSVPSPEQAMTHRYAFVPIPMDQPPIDKRTFDYYFQNPEHAEESVIWATRFPQLQGRSLFFGTRRLALGWGFEITEERNWELFMWGNLFALLLSGTIAGLWAWTTGNTASGIAIGAWLSSVQTLVISSLFWRWTRSVDLGKGKKIA